MNLTDLQAQVLGWLDDSGALVWSAEAVAAGARLALAEYNLHRSSPCSLAGLDGAETTSLPAAHESLLVLGAAGYTIQGRAAKRAESFNLDQDVPEEIAEWGRLRLNDFRALLRGLRSSETAAALTPPYGADPAEAGGTRPGWPLDEWDQEAQP